MRTLNKTLGVRLEQAERDANDQSLPEKKREAQAANASALRNFIALMGVPKDIKMEMLDSPQAVEELDASELRSFIQKSSETELDKLPDDVFDSIMSKLNG